MEFILCIVIVLVICICAGISVHYIIAGAALLAAVLAVLYTLFFFYSFYRVLTSKKCSAEFIKIDKHPKMRFSTAFYRIDNKEYPNAFPCEAIMRKKLYKNNSACNVRLNEKTGSVYDKNALATCFLGVAFSAVVVAVLFVVVRAFLA